METRIDILNELKELSPLIAGMEKVNIFTIPVGYFDTVPGDIIASLREENSSLINSVSGHPTFDVPSGYFDNLADTILAKLKTGQNEWAGELREMSPMLYSIQNENVFEVPAGYFESLPGIMLEKLVPQQAKVVTIRRRSFSFMKYAVAAAFTGIMALGVFKFTGSTKETVVVDPVVAEGTRIANENRFDEELAKITDADIVKYLEANSSNVDAALVANTVDEKELPSPEDYLTDDKALDKYLNSININDVNN